MSDMTELAAENVRMTEDPEPNNDDLDRARCFFRDNQIVGTTSYQDLARTFAYIRVLNTQKGAAMERCRIYDMIQHDINSWSNRMSGSDQAAATATAALKDLATAIYRKPSV